VTTTSAARHAGWFLAAALVGSGCFSYVPAPLDTVPPGGEVRVHLTRDGVAADLARVAGEESPSVDGTLVRGDRDQLVVRVPVAVQATGILTRSLGQDVTIPATRITQLERRQLNRPRSVLAAAAGGAALAAVLFSFGQGVPDPELPPRQEPDELRSVGWAISIGVP
jgi:hypothetical protein